MIRRRTYAAAAARQGQELRFRTLHDGYRAILECRCSYHELAQVSDPYTTPTAQAAQFCASEDDVQWQHGSTRPNEHKESIGCLDTARFFISMERGPARSGPIRGEPPQSPRRSNGRRRYRVTS